jgi:hypothetical protein
MMESISSSETSLLSKVTLRNSPEGGILQNSERFYRRLKNFHYYNSVNLQTRPTEEHICKFSLVFCIVDEQGM